ESIARHMDDYYGGRWTEKLAALTGIERGDAEESRREFRQEIDRFKQGLQLLKDSAFPDVKQSFLLMNKSMNRANQTHQRWRLFQIVFIVSQIPELASREHPSLASEQDGLVELLWFAAGGGKTEAFMGLILWQAFFDRLRGKRFGTSAFVRFPLRLLTFQQLQRFGRVFAHAELLRTSERLGGARFSVGYFVGGTVTPNSVSDEDHRRFEKEGVGRWQRIFACPFCGSKVAASYAATLRLIEHRCTSISCPGGATRLPIYIVDDDLYRFLPTVIVSTVDKLALL